MQICSTRSFSFVKIMLTCRICKSPYGIIPNIAHFPVIFYSDCRAFQIGVYFAVIFYSKCPFWSVKNDFSLPTAQIRAQKKKPVLTDGLAVLGFFSGRRQGLPFSLPERFLSCPPAAESLIGPQNKSPSRRRAFVVIMYVVIVQRRLTVQGSSSRAARSALSTSPRSPRGVRSRGCSWPPGRRDSTMRSYPYCRPR